MPRECLVIQSEGIMESTLLQTSKSSWDTLEFRYLSIRTNMNSNSINFGLVDDLKWKQYCYITNLNGFSSKYKKYI